MWRPALFFLGICLAAAEDLESDDGNTSTQPKENVELLTAEQTSQPIDNKPVIPLTDPNGFTDRLLNIDWLEDQMEEIVSSIIPVTAQTRK